VIRNIVNANTAQIRRIWSKFMHYLFVDSAIICKWCKEPLMQVVEETPDNVILRLCPVCDRWPPGLLQRSGEDEVGGE